MVVNKVIIEDLKDKRHFLELHQQVFGVMKDIITPDIIKLIKKDNGDTVGFLSGYMAYDNSFYIQYAGIMPEFRNKGFIRHFKSMLEDNVSYITATENTNTAAMKTLMVTGFLPIGGRYGGDLKYYVEWSRPRRSDNG